MEPLSTLACAFVIAAAPPDGPTTPDRRPGRDLFGVRDAASKKPKESSTNRWGTVTLSSGERFTGWLSLSYGRSLEFYVPDAKKWHKLHLSEVKRMEAVVRSEEFEKEWRWKEGGSDVKVYTGRGYPRRWLNHNVVMVKGKRFTGHLNGAVVHVTIPPPPPGIADKAKTGAARTDAKRGKDAPRVTTKKRFILRQYERGKLGTTLDDLTYVKLVVLTKPPADGDGTTTAPPPKRP